VRAKRALEAEGMEQKGVSVSDVIAARTNGRPTMLYVAPLTISGHRLSPLQFVALTRFTLRLISYRD